MTRPAAPLLLRWLVCLLCGPSLPGASLAAAQDGHAGAAQRTSSLSWVRMPGAEPCVSSRRLAEAVEKRLGRPVFVSAARADLSVEGRVARVETGGFHATLIASDPGGEVLGERELSVEGDDCHDLEEPLVLVIAVMIDPDAALSAEPSRATRPPPERGAAAPPTQRVVRVPVTRPWGLQVGGGIGVVSGLLPGAALSLVGSVLVDPPGFWGVELEGALLASAVAAAGDRGEAKLAMIFGGLLLCPLRVSRAAVGARLCAGAEAGAIRVTGPPGDPAVERVMGQLILRLRLRATPAAPVRIWARPSLLVPLRRQAFVYRDGGGTERTLFAPPALGASLDVGVSLHFDL